MGEKHAKGSPGDAGRMRPELSTRAAGVPLRRQTLGPDELRLHWLGQAGFLLEWEDQRILIDAYLSDWLARENRGKSLPHLRLMQSPAVPEALRDITYSLATHAHPDHLDPGALPALQEGNPGCRFVVPRAEAGTAEALGLKPQRLVLVNAGETIPLGVSARLSAIASAHEDLATDGAGNYRNLGYVMSLGPFTLYHSGDCVPYEGLAASLLPFGIQICLLPVNGRDEKRTSLGIIGNFTLEESIELAKSIGSEFLLGQHFGLFDFNTVDPRECSRIIRERNARLASRYMLVEAGIEYRFRVPGGT
jgi:L-ascorbate metabolism protein UlaG (beta-lactamase superfamily)